MSLNSVTKLDVSFFQVKLFFPKKPKTVKKNSVHFIAYLITNPNDDSSQLNFDVYYITVALKLTII